MLKKKNLEKHWTQMPPMHSYILYFIAAPSEHPLRRPSVLVREAACKKMSKANPIVVASP